jgi:hypothetical protein
VTIEEVARDPRYLLHRVDPVRRQLQFRPTSADAVRDAAFIDGRTDIWTGPPVAFPFDAVGQVAPPRRATRRAIFHMSFCGSTLLARLLDRPGKVLALKEPNCLADIANWKSTAGTDLGPLLGFAMAMLGRPWGEGEQVLLKPSSWANNIIDDLLAQSPMYAMFVVIARDRFLEAVLRGGNERLAFTARLAAHLAPFVDGGLECLQAAIDSAEDAVGKVSRLALVAHHFELRLFERAIGSGKLARAQVVDFAGIEKAPLEAASRAADALQLGLDRSDIAANASRWTSSNAKADASFSADQRASENAQVRAVYGSLIDDALAWADGALGSATLRRG